MNLGTLLAKIIFLSLFQILLSIPSYTFADTYAVPRSQLPWRSPPSNITTTPLGDGSILLSGDFELLGDLETGSAAILTAEGKLQPAFPGLTLTGIQIPLAKRFPNGNLVAYINPSSTRFSSQEVRPKEHWFETEQGSKKVNFIYERPAAILDDGKLVFIKSSSFYAYINGNATWVTRTSIHYGTLSENGDIEHSEYTPNFTSTGGLKQVLPLNDGKLLLLTPQHGGAGQLVRLLPDLTQDPSFDSSQLPPEVYDLSNATLTVASNGELFAHSTHSPNASDEPLYLLRITPSGAVDQTFTAPSTIPTTELTQVQVTQNGYRITNLHNTTSETCNAIIELSTAGDITKTIRIPSHDSVSGCESNRIILLNETTTLAVSPSPSVGAAVWHNVDDEGQLTPTDLPALSSIPMAFAQWTENQELLFSTNYKIAGSPYGAEWKHAIANPDGSIRLILNPEQLLPEFTTPLGKHLRSNGEYLAPDGATLDKLPLPADARIVHQTHYGLLYVIIPNTAFSAYPNPPYLAARFFPNGERDSSFAPFPIANYPEALVTTFNKSVYLLCYSVEKHDRVLYRLHHDGSLDQSFTPATFSRFPTQIQATTHGIYLAGDPIYSFHVNETYKPFGARLTNDGTLDSTYAPENYLDEVSYAPNQKSAITRDGHIFRFALRKGGMQRLESQIWHIPPQGDPSLVDPDTYWHSNYIEVSPDGSLFLSGYRTNPFGRQQTSEVIHTRTTAHSIHQRVLEHHLDGTTYTPVAFAQPEKLSFQWYQGTQILEGQTSFTLSPTPEMLERPQRFGLVVTDLIGNSTTIGPFGILNEGTLPPTPVLFPQPQALTLSIPNIIQSPFQLLTSDNLTDWLTSELIIAALNDSASPSRTIDIPIDSPIFIKLASIPLN